MIVIPVREIHTGDVILVLCKDHTKWSRVLGVDWDKGLGIITVKCEDSKSVRYDDRDSVTRCDHPTKTYKYDEKSNLAYRCCEICLRRM